MSTYVRTDWVARNEYTTPIKEVPIIEIVELLKLLQRKMKRFRLEGSRMRSLKMKNFNILFLHSGRL